MGRAAALALLTASIPMLPLAEAAGRGPAQAATTAKRCEVVIVGLIHEYLGRSYRPAHLRALYDAVRPTAMAIEAMPSSVRSGSPSPTLNENLEAVDYSRRAGIPVLGVDWEWSGPPPRDARPVAPAAVRPAALSPAEARRLQVRQMWAAVALRQHALLGNVPDLLATINSAPYQDILRALTARHASSAWYPGFDEVNDTIAANIRSAARQQCAGGRLLVTYGVAHKPELEKRLAGAPEIRLRSVADWLPLAPGDVTAREQPGDLWQVLQMTLENLEVLSTPDAVPRGWIQEKSSEIEQRARTDPEAKYYLGRWLTVAGEWPRAAELLRDVVREAGERTLTIFNPSLRQLPLWFWPPELTLRRRAAFALGLVHDLAGQRDSAVATYRMLKSEIEPSAPGERPRGLLPWLDKFLAEPYTGHPDQYLHVLFPL